MSFIGWDVFTSGAKHHQLCLLGGQELSRGGCGHCPSLREGMLGTICCASDRGCVQVLHKFSTMLHPHHYQVIEIKEKLAQILGNFAPYTLHSMPRHLKERKRQLCQVDFASMNTQELRFCKQYPRSCLVPCQERDSASLTHHKEFEYLITNPDNQQVKSKYLCSIVIQ